jgi:hypothetical protein
MQGQSGRAHARYLSGCWRIRKFRAVVRRRMKWCAMRCVCRSTRGIGASHPEAQHFSGKCEEVVASEMAVQVWW